MVVFLVSFGQCREKLYLMQRQLFFAASSQPRDVMSFLQPYDSYSTWWHILIEFANRFYSPLPKKKVLLRCNSRLFFIFYRHLISHIEANQNQLLILSQIFGDKFVP